MRWVWRAVDLGLVALLLLIAVPYDVDSLDPDLDGPVVVTDRRGVVLRTVPYANRGRGEWMRLSSLPPTAVLAVLASEDAGFFGHHGVDPTGLGRAVWLDLRRHRLLYGGSTITMQLVKLLHGNETHRNLGNKLREVLWALRLERAVDKQTILEQYLNRAYYGHGAYGFGAAATTYFNKPAESLTSGEALLLAMLPRAPTAYDPLLHLDVALQRRDDTVERLFADGLIDADERDRAHQPVSPALHAQPFLAPHFVNAALASLPPDVQRHGGRIRTTLDANLQTALEARVKEHVASLAAAGLQQAGVVVLDTQNGEVLAYVGSADFASDDGQVDIVTRLRHPGSALKPFVYAEAIEAGASPSSLALDLADVPSAYKAHHVSGQPEHGQVRFRQALAGSYNLAAIHVLEAVGVEKVLMRLRQAGLGDLDEAPDTYGLRLALGSAKVRLLDLTAGYGFVVRSGTVIPPHLVISADAPSGRRWTAPNTTPRQVFTADTSWLTMDMLADADARHQTFGHELPLDLPLPVAAKTGTSRGFADTVTVAATREYTVGAWAGSFDGKPTNGLVAMQSAAPIARAALLLVAHGKKLTLPPPPTNLTRHAVCPLSGQPIGPHCDHQILEWARTDQPTTPCNWDHSDGQRALAAWHL